jgi:DNA-binding NtrC family response regulator
MVGTSPAMRRIFDLLAAIAPTSLSVLLTGETGTGKELAARAIHEASAWRQGPFVVVDCGAIPPSLAESILFGHEKGSFTGAHVARRGALAEADGGTLFLDEIGELPLEAQPKLLRALAERKVQRVGAVGFKPIQVRAIAATHHDLRAEIAEKRFRSDLYYRIAQVQVELPPLRARAEDIPTLIRTLCHPAVALPFVDAWIRLQMEGYTWPGNVRELANMVAIASALRDKPGPLEEVMVATMVSRFPQPARQAAPPIATPAPEWMAVKRDAIFALEKTYFTQLFHETGGNVSEIERRTGGSFGRSRVRVILQRHGLRK